MSTKRTYTVQTVENFLPGDIIKRTRTIVEQVERTETGHVLVTFRGGRQGEFFGTERFGLYRVAA